MAKLQYAFDQDAYNSGEKESRLGSIAVLVAVAIAFALVLQMESDRHRTRPEVLSTERTLQVWEAS